MTLPAKFAASVAGFVRADGEGEVVRGPNIKPVPLGEPVAEDLEAPVLLKLGDKVSTDDISPAGSAVLVFRSNVPAIAEFSFKYVDPEFVARAKAAGRGIIVGGEHYGQGSSREAAVMAPMYLGVRAVIVKSFARIHRANLINWGVVPLVFDDPAAADGIERDDRLRLDGLRAALAAGRGVTVDEHAHRCVVHGLVRPDAARARHPPRRRRPGAHEGPTRPWARPPTPRSGRAEIATMNQRKIPAVYMRGGTSRCLVFHEHDLPAPGPGARPHPSGRARQPRPLRPAARRPGRRHLLALEGLSSSARRPCPAPTSTTRSPRSR